MKRAAKPATPDVEQFGRALTVDATYAQDFSLVLRKDKSYDERGPRLLAYQVEVHLCRDNGSPKPFDEVDIRLWHKDTQLQEPIHQMEIGVPIAQLSEFVDMLTSTIAAARKEWNI